MIKVPKPATLAKYGLTAEEWLAILERQGGKCAICGVVPANGRLVTDHEHVRGFRRLPKSQRAQYVRGILCNFCNWRVVRKGMTVDRLYYGAMYLNDYKARREADEAP